MTLEDGMKSALNQAFSNPGAPPGSVPTAIRIACADLVSRGAENCTLVALTNVSGAAADLNIHPQMLMKQAGGVDFRSLYKKATRPILLKVAAHLSVSWNPSGDPFVSNPFREMQIDDAWVARRKNKLQGARDLLTILSFVTNQRAEAQSVLGLLAENQLERLSSSQVHYNIPPRLTTAYVSELLSAWLETSSSGSRLENVSVALLRFAGAHVIGGFDQVLSHNVNDPRPHDALCMSRGTTVAIGECKDQPITDDHVVQLSRELATHGATRGYLFTRRRWLDHAESQLGAIAARIRERSTFGYRIDVIDVMEAVRTWLSLIDRDDGILPAFMRVLTDELDQHGLLSDRRELASLIERLSNPPNA